MDNALRELIDEAVRVLGWHSHYADVECPGGHQDARLYFDRRFPHLHCLHSKCAEDVAALNHELRERAAEIRGEGNISIELSPEEKRAEAFHDQLRKIMRDTQTVTLPKILREPEVGVESFMAESNLSESRRRAVSLGPGLSRSQIYQLIGSGAIKSVSLRRRGTTRGTRLICLKSLFAFLNSRIEGGKSSQLSESRERVP
jgi:hypothetical protein